MSGITYRSACEYVFDRTQALDAENTRWPVSQTLNHFDDMFAHIIQIGKYVFKYDKSFFQHLNYLRQQILIQFANHWTPFMPAMNMVDNYGDTAHNLISNNKRYDVMHQISVIIKKNEHSEPIEIVNRHNWRNTQYDISGGVSLLPNPANKVRTLDKRLKQVIYVLKMIYLLLDADVYATKRDVYYANVSLFNGSQRVVDEIVDDLASSLRLSRYNMHIVSSSRGHVFGHLSFRDGSGHLTDCLLSPNGVNIPNDIETITSVTSEALFVLIVEKDATFQLLIDMEIHKYYPVIMVTAHGYPDLNTRAFVKLLWDKLRIPMLGLMDCDAHGLEILCCYRHGSLALSYFSDNLVVPVIKWMGILPRDIFRLKLSTEVLIPLNDRDRKKIQDLRQRPYIRNNKDWSEQLDLMESLGYKAEIQCLAEYWPLFILNEYIPAKIRYGEWV